jgi:hypothetical protein
MAESYDECPECKSDDLKVESIRDIRAPQRQERTSAAADKPVARTIWVRCRSCGWSGPIVRKLSDTGPAA